MKGVIRFSRFFIPAAIISTIIIILGVGGYIYFKGFNLGVDFQAGLIQEVQFAPTAFTLNYNGAGNASVTLSRTRLDIVLSGAGVHEQTYSFDFASYPNGSDLVKGMQAIEGIGVTVVASGNFSTTQLVQSSQSNPRLEADKPLVFHYLPQDVQPVPIENVRTSLASLGGTAAVQVLGTPAERRFMIRMEDKDFSSGSGGVSTDKVISVLENSFGAGEVAIINSNYVGSRFSKDLSNQALYLMALTLMLILAYMAIRIGPDYAIGAVLGIINDGIVMVAFIVWSKMEFNTTTIAAILTILGYSTTNVIVIFDRIKENRKMYPDDPFVDVLNRSLTMTLNRTIITTVSTMIAVVSLVIFTTGSMRDFGIALLVGMTSGEYTAHFIASGFLNFWETKKTQRQKRKLTLAASGAKA